MCDCVKKINEELEPMEIMLAAALNITNMEVVFAPPQIKLEKTSGKRFKRSDPKVLFASHCPWCGEKYQKSGGREALE